MEYTNVFTVHHINHIGGVESWLYYIAKKYKDRDITVLYDKSMARMQDIDQIDRLRRYVRVMAWDGVSPVKCKRVFFNYACFGLDTIEAEEKIYVIHADYKRQRIVPPSSDKITKYLAVSVTAKESFEEVYHVPVEVSYNPMVLDEPRKVLHLISATRLSPEKGYDRMLKLAKALKKADIPYIWNVFTYDKVDEEYFSRCKVTFDIANYIADADALVQLSDSEAYCYSVREALVLGTPCITTDLQTFREIGVEEGKTGWLLPLDMSTIPVESIYKGLPPFRCKDVDDVYDELLGAEKSTYIMKDNPMMEVKVKQLYLDVVFNRVLRPDEIQMMPFKRAMELEGKGFVEVIYKDE